MWNHARNQLLRWIRLGVDVREPELAALLWSFGYFFTLLCSYSILRPLRDEMAIQGGIQNLAWMFTGTFLAMCAAVPVFGWVGSRFSKRHIVPIVYRFFIANLLIFYVLMQLPYAQPTVAVAFFIWVSLFNLFVVSVFWSFMADLYREEQSERLFGFVAAGGTVGALLGPSVTALFSVQLGPVPLILISALLLEGSVQCIHRILSQPSTTDPGASPDETTDQDRIIGGHVFAGATNLLKSRYLIGIALFIMLYTTTSTFLYFEQAHIVEAAFAESGQRTRVFAAIDLLVNGLTLGLQWLVSGRYITRLGVGGALVLLPGLTAAGFATLALYPVLWVLIGFQGVRRASNYAITKPTREILYTVVPDEQKYKAKNFIDTVIYRGGDVLSGWAFAGLQGLGWGLSAIAWVGVPIAVVWAGLAWILGKWESRRAGPAPGNTRSAPGVLSRSDRP